MRSLNCKYLVRFYEIIQSYASRWLFWLLHWKVTWSKLKIRWKFCRQIWKKSCFIWKSLIITSIKKSLSLLSMPMKIQNHFNRSLLKSIDNLIFDEIYLRIVLFGRVLPSSIQITANKWTSIIPMYHTIRIDHGKDLKWKIVS